jgi:hypothetical protein
VRRREQSPDDAWIGIRTAIGEKGIEFRRRRREPGEVKGYPAQEFVRRGFWRWLQAGPLKGCEDEVVE